MNLLRLLTIQGAAQSMAELITDLQLGGSGDADQRLATVARRTRRGVRCLRPAATMVEVRALIDLKMLVEIEAEAIVME